MDILLDIIESFATMVLDNPRIQQAEINPLIATPNGVWAVDPKIVIG
jgi:succinyl-CoA synthetase beta subunit